MIHHELHWFPVGFWMQFKGLVDSAIYGRSTSVQLFMSGPPDLTSWTCCRSLLLKCVICGPILLQHLSFGTSYPISFIWPWPYWRFVIEDLDVLPGMGLVKPIWFFWHNYGYSIWFEFDYPAIPLRLFFIFLLFFVLLIFNHVFATQSYDCKTGSNIHWL